MGQREKERTRLQPMLFPPEEAKLVGPRETNPLLADLPSVFPFPFHLLSQLELFSVLEMRREG